MKSFVLSALVLVLVAVPSRADHCAKAVVVQKQVVTQAVVVQQAAIVTPYVQTVAVVPQAVYVPLYSAVYAPPDNSALIEELRNLKSELRAVQSLQAQPVRTQELKAPSVTMLQSKCASCHAATSADERGDGLVMFAEGRLILRERDRARARALVAAGEMPKGGKLSPEDKQALIELLK